MLPPRAIYLNVYDRYLPGLMPLVIIFLILSYQRVAEDDMPAICFLMLGAFYFGAQPPDRSFRIENK